jgi:single-stranded-DNA-specific exonuclease
MSAPALLLPDQPESLAARPEASPPAGPSLPEAPPRRLEIPPCDLAAALGLQEALGVGRVLAQVLIRRGLSDPETARRFLAAGEAHDPARFGGMAEAVARIRRHIAAGGLITVHGDYDVDGVCATAITVRVLRRLGAEVNWFLPGRMEDGYGLSGDTVARLAARGTALLLTVDCGITAVEEVQAARSAGLEVIITDHHSPRADGRLPDCDIVHPALGGYPCAELCGTGVAFKLAEALGAPELPDELELVALATVADLMPLQGENRRLVREGLRALANTTRPGLRALLASSGTDPSELSAGALGFRQAPRINAAGRMRRADDPGRAREIAAELETVNAERRAVEQRILWQAEAQVAELGPRPAYVLAGEDWHPGVIGIVASRIVEHHNRPAVLIALGPDGMGQGSGRSIPGFDLLGGLERAAPHLERYGGHRMAAGLSVATAKVAALREALEEHAAEVLTPELLTPVERVDAVVCGSELGLDLAEELAALEPCGMGNPRVRLLVPGARFSDVRPMGEGRHARFSVASGGARSRAVSFGCDGRVPGADGEPVNATFALERNVWNGAVEPRLLLRHASPCVPRPLDIPELDGPYLDAVLAELARPMMGTGPSGPERIVVDRRGASPLTAVVEAQASGGKVLALCACVHRRLEARTGGFTLMSYGALAADPRAASEYSHLIALDPPPHPDDERRLRSGPGYAVLAWGEAELRFAQQMHEHEYDLRPSLAALYRELRGCGRAAGERLERLLRGQDTHPRSPGLAARLVRVLAELGLARLDTGAPALELSGQAQTSLERSAAYRAYCQRHGEGRRFLSSVSLRPRG